MALSEGSIFLTTAYLPPVQYFSKFVLKGEIWLEQHENYQKQSYRNRCHIYGANGLQSLVIPVTRTDMKPYGIREVGTDLEKDWQKNHWKAIESAYRLSPWFEFYANELREFYERKAGLLFDWNLMLITHLAGILQLDVRINLTSSFARPGNDPSDLRYSIHPKDRSTRTDPAFKPVSYQQVFANRFGFIPNLSIIDLIFNEGPYAMQILKNSVC